MRLIPGIRISNDEEGRLSLMVKARAETPWDISPANEASNTSLFVELKYNVENDNAYERMFTLASGA